MLSMLRAITGAHLGLIRHLVAERIDPDQSSLVEAGPAWEMGRAELMGTPEATAYTIATSVNDLVDQGLMPGEVLARIEAYRCSLTGLSISDPGQNPLAYVVRRVSLEHPSAERMTPERVAAAALAAEAYHRAGKASGNVAAAIYYGRAKAIQLQFKVLADAVTDYLDGELTDDEFLKATAQAVEGCREARRRMDNKVAAVRLQRALDEA